MKSVLPPQGGANRGGKQQEFGTHVARCQLTQTRRLLPLLLLLPPEQQQQQHDVAQVANPPMGLNDAADAQDAALTAGNEHWSRLQHAHATRCGKL